MIRINDLYPTGRIAGMHLAIYERGYLIGFSGAHKCMRKLLESAVYKTNIVQVDVLIMLDIRLIL